MAQRKNFQNVAFDEEITGINQRNSNTYFAKAKPIIQQIMMRYLTPQKPIKYRLTISCEFKKPEQEDNVQLHFSPENFKTMRSVNLFNDQNQILFPGFDLTIFQIHQ